MVAISGEIPEINDDGSFTARRGRVRPVSHTDSLFKLTFFVTQVHNL